MTDDKATPASELAEAIARVQDWADDTERDDYLDEDIRKLLVALAAERARADRAEARIAEAVVWDDYRDAHVFGDMGTPYVNGARHAHAAIARILREATA